MLSGRYRVVDRIGVGGMAEVFRAHDELLRRDVAVKVFKSHAVSSEDTSGADRQQLELQALARLNHPHLITLFDGSIGPTDGPAFLVMELVNGPTLATRIADGPVPEAEVREIGNQVADALAYVHNIGMVHRDVKPANILLGTDRTVADTSVRARLSDFGIVRLLGSERLTSAEFTLGTASYLAPEQARGSDVGPVADVYSLGLVLIEALTGVRSYDGPPIDAVMARLSRGPDIPTYLPQPWPSLLAAMTALEPESRPTAEQVAHALGDDRSAWTAAAPIVAAAPDAPTAGFAAFGAPPLQTGTDDPWAPADEPGRRRRTTWLLAAAAVAVALAIGALLYLRPTSKSDTPADRQPADTHGATSSSVATNPEAPVGPVGDSTHDSSTAAPTHTASDSTSAPTTSEPPPSTSDAPSTSAPPSTSEVPSTSTTPTVTPTQTPTSPGVSSSVATSSIPPG
jgi:eukaryotic-like serine/threonine-protein kinase